MNIHFDGAVGPFERVIWASEPDVGLRAIVAVHSTALGPAIGGARFTPYPDDALAMVDALRLAEGMSMKAAAAGLDVGGGKSVIVGDPARIRSPELLRAFGVLVDRLGGDYLVAEDVGTTMADMDVIRSATPHVLGLSAAHGGHDADPSPFTCRGVLAAIRGAWEWATGEPDLVGARVAIQGVGKVGACLAEGLAQAGAEIQLADVDERRAHAVAAQVGGRVVPSGRILGVACDILAPCALGGALTSRVVADLRCRVVAGSANNQLAHDGVAGQLAAREILYVPDFVANAGGLVSVAEGRRGWDTARIGDAVDTIADRVRDILDAAAEDGGTPLAHALAAARRRLDGRVAA